MPDLNIRKIRRSAKKLSPEAEETEVEGDEEPEAGEPGNLIAMPASS